MIGYLTISTTGYLTNVCIWWSSFLSSFCFIITSLRHFIKAAEYICNTMMGISSFLSFAALMKLDLTCLEKALSATFAIIGRIVPYSFPFALCALSVLLVIKSLSDSGITFKTSLARISFVWSQLSLHRGCLIFFEIKILHILLFLDSSNSFVSSLYLISRVSILSTNDW